MADSKSIVQQLAHVTVRLECKRSGGETAVGTGFCFAFHNTGGQMVPAIITNRHVLEGADAINLSFTKQDSARKPRIGDVLAIRIKDCSGLWLRHPDSDVDLAALPFGSMITEADRNGTPIYYRTVDKSFIPSAEKLSTLTALEEIIMVGYPIGLWDQHNNMPIFRKGITATHPSLDYNGRREFVIDAACFPGSSGSPVFRYKPASPITSSGTIKITRGGPTPTLELLGVLWGGPHYNAQGKIEAIAVPTQQVNIPVTRIPTNLGFVIRAERLLEFEPLLQPKTCTQQDGAVPHNW